MDGTQSAGVFDWLLRVVTAVCVAGCLAGCSTTRQSSGGFTIESVYRLRPDGSRALIGAVSDDGTALSNARSWLIELRTS